MDRARDQLLAGAALAGDQDRGGRARDPPHERDDIAHRLALRDDVVEAELVLDLALQPRDLAAQRALAERLVGDEQQLLDLERLGDVVVRAELDRADRGLDRAERGDHHDVRRLGQRHHAADQVEAVHLGHPQVGDDQVEPVGARELEAGRGARRRLDLEPRVLELLGQQVAHRLVVLDDQDRRGPLGRHRTRF